MKRIVTMMLTVCLMGGFVLSANAQGPVKKVKRVDQTATQQMTTAPVQQAPANPASKKAKNAQNAMDPMGIDNGATMNLGETLGAYVSNVNMYILAKNESGDKEASSYMKEADKLERTLNRSRSEMSEKQVNLFDTTKEKYHDAKGIK